MDDFENVKIEDLKERLELLETVIEEIKQLDLYESTIGFNWEETPYSEYYLFDVDEFIENVKYQKQLTK